MVARGRIDVLFNTDVRGAGELDDLADSASETEDSLGGAADAAGLLPGPLGDAAGFMTGPAGLVAGAAAVGTALFNAATNAADTAIEVDELSAFLGVSVEQADQFRQAFGLAGIEANDLQDIVAQTNGVLADNTELAAQLGVDMSDSVSPAERFLQATEAVQEIASDSERLNLGAQLYGEEGVRQMNALFARTEDVRALVEDTEPIIDDDDVEQARRFQEQMQEVKREVGLVSTELGQSTIPLFIEGADQAGRIAGNLNDAVGYLNDFVNLIPGAEDGGGFFGAAGDAIEIITGGFGSLAQTKFDDVNEQLETVVGATRSVGEEGVANFEAFEAASERAFALADEAGASYAENETRRFQDIAEDGVGRVLERLEDLQAALGTLNQERAFLRLRDSAREYVEAVESGELSTDDARLALIDLIGEVETYASDVAELPPEVVTDIVTRLDEGSLADVEAVVGELGEGVVVPVRFQSINQLDRQTLGGIGLVNGQPPVIQNNTNNVTVNTGADPRAVTRAVERAAELNGLQ